MQIFKIYCVKACGWKFLDIGCSRIDTYRNLSESDDFETKLRSGKTKKTIKQQDRHILKLFYTQNLSVRSLFKDASVLMSKSMVYRWLQAITFLGYRKMRRTGILTKRYVHWPWNPVNSTNKLLSVLFSDEKKINLDCPKGSPYYWHDIRKEPRFFSAGNK